MPTKDIIDPDIVADEFRKSAPEDTEELSRSERAELVQQAEAAAMKKTAALTTLGSEVEGKFRKFASHRKEKEDEWTEVLANFNNKSGYYNPKGELPGTKRGSRRPTVNITRARTLTAIEKMQDIQFPLGGDYNFHIDPIHSTKAEKNVNNQTPDPAQAMRQEQAAQLQGQAQPGQLQGQAQQAAAAQQPPTVGQQAQSVIDENQEKAYNMEMKIKGQFVYTKYGKKARKAMRDWGILGTAILKGPVLETRSIKMYNHYRDSDGGLQSELVKEFEEVPSVFCVDPRFFFPDYALEADDIVECVELHPMTKKELTSLAEDESFMKSRIRKAAELDPDITKSGISMDFLYGFGSDVELKDRYWVKEYHGPLSKEVLFELDEITLEEKEDALQQFYGSVWVVHNEVIRVSLSLIEGDDAHPYNIVVWEEDDSSPFGHGMPYLMMDQQRVVEATWQMLIDNSGLSAGPQIVLNKDSITPANGKWEIEPMKIWYNNEFGGDVQSAFQFVDIPNNQQQLMSVIDSAMQFADLESQSPMIQANTAPEANVPAMNMGMVLTEANVHQRELSQKWDDGITLPLVNRFVHYNMQYDDDPDIKGNFKANVGGATERIDNQILAQDIERILAMGAQSPEYMLNIKADQAFRRWVAATRAGPELLRSAEEVEVEKQRLQQEAANAPPDAEMIRAQAVAQREEARQAEMQADIQMKQAEMQFKQQQAQQDAQMKILEMQLRRAELMAEAKKNEIELQIALIEASNKRDIDMAKIRKDLAITEDKSELERELKAIDLAKFQQEMDVKERTGTGI